MTTPLWCLMFGVLMPYLLAGASIPFRNKQFGTVDLDHPRVQGDALTGAGARSWAAQSNAWEAVIVFACATLVAYVAGVDPAGSWATASLIWVFARASHAVFYIGGQTVPRIIAFAVGMGMSIWIFVMAVQV